MPNEFIIKNGLISQNNVIVTGSITVTDGIIISGSSVATLGSNTFIGTEVISGSLTISGSGTPFTLNTDVLEVTGSIIVTSGLTGSVFGTSSYATTASHASNTSFLNNSGSGEFVPTGSFNTFSSSILTYTGSANSRLSSIESKTGSYATTGSNTFVDGQYLSSSFNPTGFSTTASLYTDGGLRVTRDAYISGTLYLNNVTVFGTQSVAYISSSQLNIGTNLITVNTDTPSIRFGGLAVYDSGSTGLTGSILWDSQNNHWIYSNPSGSSYSGGMFISGPRTSTLGSETGTTSCMLLAGQGGDHLTSSMIYHSSTVTCIPNTLIGSTICGSTSTFSSTSTACNFVTSGNTLFGITLKGRSADNFGAIGFYSSDGGTRYGYIQSGCVFGGQVNMTGDGGASITLDNRGFNAAGIATFSCRVCAPNINLSNGISINACSTVTVADWYNTNTDDGNGLYIKAGGVNSGKYVMALESAAGCPRMIVLANGNVGIGTTSPATLVQAVKDTNNSATFSSRWNSSGYWSQLEIRNYSSNLNTQDSPHFRIMHNFNDEISNGYIGFHRGNDLNGGFLSFGTNGSERMRISGTGNVGIGCTSPSYSLDINDTNGSGVRGMRISTSSSSVGPSIVLRYSPGGLINWLVGTSQLISHSLEFIASCSLSGDPGVSGATRMLLTCGGQLGIGTTSTSTEANLFLGAQGVNEGGQMVFQKGTSCSCATHLDNYEDKFRILVGTDTSSNAVHFQLDHKTRCATFYGGVRQTASSGALVYQRIAGIKAAAGSGNAINIAYVGHTHTITVRAYARLNDSNAALITQVFSTAYGSSAAGASTVAGYNLVSSISLAYNNSGYTIQVTPIYSSSAPDIYFTIEGISHDTMYVI